MYLQLRDYLRDRIISGDLPPGSQLTPERRLAAELGVDRNTVSNAYGELYAEGLIEGHVGRGTFVKELPLCCRVDARPLPWIDYFGGVRAHEPDGIYGLSLREDLMSFACGVVESSLYPNRAIQKAMEKVLRTDSMVALKMSPVEGHGAFRVVLTDLMREAGVETSPENIMVTNGVQQGLDLLSRAFINKGDTVVVAKPSYVGAVGMFEAAGAYVDAIPLDDEGMQLDALERVIRSRQPTFIYTVPNFNNPTGVLMSAQRREKLLALARRYQVPLVEDNPHGDLYFEEAPPPPLKAIDDHGHVIYLSSFSKTIAPGMRLGWMVAPRPVIKRLGNLKLYADMHTNTLLQCAVAEFIQSGGYAEHLTYLRQQLAHNRRTIERALITHIGERFAWSIPAGGMYVWCQLPPNITAEALHTEALKQHITFATGPGFYPENGGGEHAFRLTFGTLTPEEIEEGIVRLAHALDAVTIA
jgi:DNA-binding transcriptional MocR family regulator